MTRWLIVVLMVLLAGLQYRLWSGDGVAIRARGLEQSVVEQRERNRLLRSRNDALAAEVEGLKQGNDAVEERARSELGLVLPGEVFYRIIESSEPDADGR